MIIWLLQYLCPNRHAIAAVPYDRDVEPAAAEGALLASIAAAGLNPWCGLCGSRDLHFEHARTRFKDWNEAITGLRALEVDQALSRALVDRLRDSN